MRCRDAQVHLVGSNNYTCGRNSKCVDSSFEDLVISANVCLVMVEILTFFMDVKLIIFIYFIKKKIIISKSNSC